MEDQTILNLYFERREAAIVQTDRKYGGYCYSIAYHILEDRDDSEDSVREAYLAAWNSIPPRRPILFSVFLGRLTRNISINHWKDRSACERGRGEMESALEELGECIPEGTDAEETYAQKETVRAIRSFVDGLPDRERRIFLRRYWYLDGTREIVERYGYSERKVKSMLHRIRTQLHAKLEEEGLL